MKIAYFVSRYPHPYQTFIRREINEMAAQGAAITVFPVIGACERDGSAADISSTSIIYTGFLSPIIFASSCIMLAAAPRACLSLLALVIAGTWKSPVNLLKSLAVFPKSLHLARLLREGNFDRIHAHWSTHPATAAMIASELSGIPFSFAFHAYDIYSTRILIPEKIEKASAVVFNCRYTLDYLRRIYPGTDEKKFHLVYNGIDLDRFRMRKSKAPADIPLILAVGQLVPTKGFEYLIEACRLLNAEGRRFKAVIIGEGPQRTFLQDLISRNGMTNARLAGRLPEKEIIEHLGMAAVFVMPAVDPAHGSHDGLPNVVMEAMASGVPVVASDVFGIPEAVENNVNGLLVPERDPAAIKNAITRLLDDTGLAGRLASAARQKVEATFDIHSNCSMLFSLFKARESGNK